MFINSIHIWSKMLQHFKKIFPLPHETTLRKQISQKIKKYTNCLVDIKGLEQILYEFMGDQKMYVALADDAAIFNMLKKKDVIVDYIATDGDHKYDE